MKVVKLKLSEIRTDGGTQPRAAIDPAVVADYAEQMVTDETALPAVVVYHDGEVHWLADGFHRYAAAAKAKLAAISADVRQGTRRDAILHSVGANAAHGLRRTNADKRRAVETLLRDEEWGGWSDREIARQCSVGHQLAATVRADLTGFSASDEQRRTNTTKHGTSSTMDSVGIAEANRARAEARRAADLDQRPEEEREAPARPTREERQAAREAEADHRHENKTARYEAAAEHEDPDEPVAGIEDAEGDAIPERLRALFAALQSSVPPVIENLTKALRCWGALRAELGNYRQGDRVVANRPLLNGLESPVHGLESEVRSFVYRLGNLIPYAVCDNCGGTGTGHNGTGCGVCDQSGWLCREHVDSRAGRK